MENRIRMNQNEYSKKMKAIICPRYGSSKIFKFEEIPLPEPKEEEVLVRNYASSINTVDVLRRSGKAPKVTHWLLKPLVVVFLRISFGGLFKPKQKIPGCGFAGEIVSVGSKVSNWQKKDQVYGYSRKAGACADFISVPASILAKKPEKITFQQAAAIPGGVSPALVAFRDLAHLKKNQNVLIIGASGGIGTFAVQIAKIYGAHVTGVCGPTNIEMLKSIGADCVIDYTQIDYLKSPQKYDIVYDVIGVSNISECKDIIKENGIFIANNPSNSFKNLFFSKKKHGNSIKLESPTADESASALEYLNEWIEQGLITPVIDTIYPLSETGNAHQHYETGHSKGRIVINIED